MRAAVDAQGQRQKQGQRTRQRQRQGQGAATLPSSRRPGVPTVAYVGPIAFASEVEHVGIDSAARSSVQAVSSWRLREQR
eukprot:7161000-Pyramimonas_sp.AAC.1